MKTLQPFYTPDPPQRVAAGTFFGSQPTADSMMQENVRQIFTYPQGFLYGSAGSGSETPESLKAHFIMFAQQLADSPVAKSTAVGFDPVERGTFYADLVIELLKEIDVSVFDWMQVGSLYDAWMRKKSA